MERFDDLIKRSFQVGALNNILLNSIESASHLDTLSFVSSIVITALQKTHSPDDGREPK